MFVEADDSDGSSPLARGLPQDKARDSEHVGIIPARAGFTVTAATRAVVLPDHPRSRGVYAQISVAQ